MFTLKALGIRHAMGTIDTSEPPEQRDAVWLEEGKGHQRKLLEGSGIEVGLEGHMGFGRRDLQQEDPGRQESMPW